MILLTLLCIIATVSSKCSNEDPPRVPKYHLMEKCHRSNLAVIYRANFSSLISCQRLGIEKKGLALNFSPPEALKDIKKGDEPLEYTCEVLKCAEADGGLSLVNDTRYDYYSIYAKHLPDINSTCIPGLGMFLFTDRLNYSAAAQECRNRSGRLGDVMSEARTEALTQLLVGAGMEAAFVDGKSDNGSEFYNVNGDTLDCTTYRAWAPGHPKRSREKYGCIALTRSKTWIAVPCQTKLPSICELNPSGPYRRCGKIFASRRIKDTAQDRNITSTARDDK
ncbi:unnamed protein product [Plutella xylostella]|uniref:(diamondback moth) hypothetical protein n=1 Tax=Plutella xylostella TaxID=51655 RepID=A0A8S4F4R2_PLUXY|nr:unnamed protein product [Plutella xylostella]